MRSIKRGSVSKYLIIIIMTAVICISGYNLWKMSERYVRESQIKNSVAKYRPEYVLNTLEQPETINTEEMQKNQFIIDLQNEINKDIVGWITIPNTHIDYPFVQSSDNDYYLRRDLYGNYALAGTIFMDYQCSRDFTDFNTIIYGHNMKNNSMFGDLTLFADNGFFDSTRTGVIFLENGTYILEFFAYVIVNSDDKIIYNIKYNSSQRKQFFEYVKKNALNYTDELCSAGESITEISISEKDIKDTNIATIVTISTCSYQFNGARSVLLATIHPK